VRAKATAEWSIRHAHRIRGCRRESQPQPDWQTREANGRPLGCWSVRFSTRASSAGALHSPAMSNPRIQIWPVRHEEPLPVSASLKRIVTRAVERAMADSLLDGVASMRWSKAGMAQSSQAGTGSSAEPLTGMTRPAHILHGKRFVDEEKSLRFPDDWSLLEPNCGAP